MLLCFLDVFIVLVVWISLVLRNGETMNIYIFYYLLMFSGMIISLYNTPPKYFITRI